MAKAGISDKLIEFADSCVGHKKGGFAVVTVIVACFFGAVSGSGPATVAALGSILLPAMAEVAATVCEEALEYLDAPVLRYGAPFTPIPFAPTLEKMYRVYPEDLVKGIKGVL